MNDDQPITPELEAFAEQIAVYREHPLFFVKDMWGLVPQPPKPEYKERYIKVFRSEGKEWLALKNTVTADWFGDCIDKETGKWQWYKFEKGKHVTWQQTLMLLALEKAMSPKNDGSVPKKISTRSGHGIGKSATGSFFILWFLLCFEQANVPATAPTSHQMHDVLWKELSKWIAKMPEEYGKLYDWSSEYVRMRWSPETWFARARTSTKENTEAIAGVHSDNVAIFVDEACHDDKTEILTNHGWKFFADLKTSDSVMTLNPSNNRGEYQYPTKHHVYDHDGPMVLVKRRGTDFMVTANHDLWVKTKKAGYRKVKAGLLTGCDMYIPRTISWEGTSVLTPYVTEDIVKLYAWFISEGSLRYYKNTKNPHTVVISQSSTKNAENCKEIIDLVTRMGYKANVYGNDILICSVGLAGHLLECGIGFKNKLIPNWIKNLPPYYLNIFLDNFVKGDGYSRTKERDILYTSSPKLANDLQEIILKTGCNSVVNKRNITGQRKWILDHFATSSCDGYVISRCRNDRHAKINKRMSKTVNYKGKTYCVTVPNGIVMTRRNGYAMWSGNSGVPNQVYDAAEGSMTSGNTFVFLIGNPVRIEGYFHETHTRFKTDWQTFSFNGEESPVVDEDFVDQKRKRHGRNSDEYGIRVKGQPPHESTMDTSGYIMLIPEDRITAIPKYDKSIFVGRRILGIDPAGEGKDKATFVIRDGFRIEMVHEMKTSNPRQIAERALSLASEFKIAPDNDIVIDGFGVGATVGQEIAISTEGKIIAYTVLVGNKPVDEEAYNGHLFKRHDDEVSVIKQGEEDALIDLFLNLRALLHFRQRNWIMRGGAIVDNPTFKNELASIKYKRSLQGNVIQIMPKKEAMKLGIPSPNIADAGALTFIRDISERTITAADRRAHEAEQDSEFDPYSVV